MIHKVATRIKERFGLSAEVTIASNIALLKVKGLDNYSLAKWITEEFDNVKVTVKDREIAGYKISDFGWIKIEQTNNKELVLT